MASNSSLPRSVGPQDPDGAGDARAEDRHRAGQRFRHHVGAPLDLAAHHQGAAAGEEAEGPPAGQRPQPPVPRISRLLAPGGPGRLGGEGGPGVEHAETRRGRPQARRRRRPQGVLDRPEVGEHDDLELLLLRRHASPRAGGRLVDDPGLGAQRGRQLVEAGRLQKDEPIRDLQRPPGPGRRPQVAVEIGPGEGHHHRPARPGPTEANDAREALARVKGHEHVGGASVVLGLDGHPVPELAQQPPPASRSDLVPRVQSRAARRDESDPQ